MATSPSLSKKLLAPATAPLSLADQMGGSTTTGTQLAVETTTTTMVASGMQSPQGTVRAAGSCFAIQHSRSHPLGAMSMPTVKTSFVIAGKFISSPSAGSGSDEIKSQLMRWVCENQHHPVGVPDGGFVYKNLICEK